MSKPSPKRTALLLVSVMLFAGIAAVGEESAPYASYDEAYAAYEDYLPEIPTVDNADSMSLQDRSHAFMQTIQDRSDELGLPNYMDWSLPDKAWLSKVANAYGIEQREEYVLPTKDDLTEEEAIEKAKAALAEKVDYDTSSLTVLFTTFGIHQKGGAPMWQVNFGFDQQVFLSGNGEVVDAQIMPSATPAPSQITFEKAGEIVKSYLMEKLRFTSDDVEKMRIDPHYYEKNPDNPSDLFLYHCYQGEEFTSVYVNADTGEVYKVGLPGLGNG